MRGSVTSEELTADCDAILRRVELGAAFDVTVGAEVVAVLVPAGTPPASVRGGFGELGRFERAESVMSALRALS